MSQQDQIAGGIGVVRVGDLEITVTPLTQGEENVLRRRLHAAARDAHGDFYTRARPLLDAMRDAPGDRLEAVRELTRLQATGSAIDAAAVFEFRFSPAGVAMELFARGRRATPGLTPDGLRAVVTEANVDDVAGQLHRVIEGDGPNA